MIIKNFGELKMNKEQFKTVLGTWKLTTTHTAAEHIVYNVLRDKAASFGFTPITNKNKIVSSSNDEWDGFNQALNEVQRTFKKNAWGYSEEKVHSLEKVFGIEFTEELVSTILNLKSV